MRGFPTVLAGFGAPWCLQLGRVWCLQLRLCGLSVGHARQSRRCQCMCGDQSWKRIVTTARRWGLLQGPGHRQKRSSVVSSASQRGDTSFMVRFYIHLSRQDLRRARCAGESAWRQNAAGATTDSVVGRPTATATFVHGSTAAQRSVRPGQGRSTPRRQRRE